MSNASERATNILARAAGNTVSPAVSAMLAVAGVVTGDAQLTALAVPISAIAGSLTEEAVQQIRRLWLSDGVQAFHDQVVEEAGVPVEDLMADAARKPVQLLGEAVAAAAHTTDDWNIQVLARALVRGARDEARVDEMRILVSTLSDLEIPDVRVLAVISRYPARTGGASLDTIAKRDPGVAKVAGILCRRLEARGFIERDAKGWTLTYFGRNCVNLLQEIECVPEVVA